MKTIYKTPVIVSYNITVAAPVATSLSISGLSQVKDNEGDWDEEF